MELGARGCHAELADLEERRSRDWALSRRTFSPNPGWDSNAQKLASFTDVRDLQRQLKAQGVQLHQQADESTTGPASFVAVDP